MKINFKKIQVPQIDGTTQEINIAEAFAKLIYNNTPTLPVAVAMQDIYKTGEADINAEQAASIKSTMEKIECTAFLKMALYPIFDKINNENNI